MKAVAIAVISFVAGYMFCLYQVQESIEIGPSTRLNRKGEQEKKKVGSNRSPELLEGQILLQKKIIQDLEAALYGPPLEWTTDIPLRASPTHFQEDVTSSFIKCGGNPDHVSLDCSEPPCIAFVAQKNIPNERSEFECLVGQIKVGHSYRAIKTLPCPDGTIEEVVFYTQDWPNLSEQGILLPEVEREHRIRVREDEIIATLDCFDLLQ